MRQEIIQAEIKTLNDKYFNTIRRILNSKSYVFTKFVEATPKQDMEEGFDSIFSFPDVKIPIRIRDYKYLNYRDITIRSRSYYGMRTEIDKLREGFGDYYFYGWETKESNGIYCYAIFSIKNFVESGLIDEPDSQRQNYDGTEFYCYSLDKMIKKNVIILYEKLAS